MLGQGHERAMVDELQRADECTDPLGVHTLQLLPELSDDVVSDLQLADPVLSVIRSWFDLAYEPTIDDLRQLPPDGRKLWSLRDNFSVVNNVLILKSADNSQLIVPEP